MPPEQLALLEDSPIPPPLVSPLPAPSRDPLTQAALLRRGWTVEAIREHLGAPSRTRGNALGGRTHLFGAARVLAVEATPAWQAWWQGQSAQLEARRQARQGRADRLVAEVAAWTPAIRRLPIDTLRTLAIDHFNQRLAARRERFQDDVSTPASEASAPAFLERLCVNYVRHLLTTYDQKLDAVSRRRDGGMEAAALVKARVFDRIAEVYPELADEARRQKARRCNGASPATSQ